MDDFTPLSQDSNEKTEEKAVDSTETGTGEVTVEDEVTEAKQADEITEEAESTLKSESLPEKFDEVLETQRQLLERVDSLSSLFRERIMYTDHEEKITDQMHRELQKYKEDMYAQLVRPILLDVIEVRDSIKRVSEAFHAKPKGEQDIPNKTFVTYAEELADILEKNDVEIYRSGVGDDFTPIRQKIIKKVVTSDETMHGKVAKSCSDGYSYKGKTISAEKIAVYRYEKTAEENEKSEVIENG